MVKIIESTKLNNNKKKWEVNIIKNEITLWVRIENKPRNEFLCAMSGDIWIP